MEDAKLIEAMNDARIISACDNVIYPLLTAKISERLQQACARFRGGDKDFIADMAYITGLQDLLQELQSKQTKGNKAIKTLHERQQN